MNHIWPCFCPCALCGGEAGLEAGLRLNAHHAFLLNTQEPFYIRPDLLLVGTDQSKSHLTYKPPSR